MVASRLLHRVYVQLDQKSFLMNEAQLVDFFFLFFFFEKKNLADMQLCDFGI